MKVSVCIPTVRPAAVGRAIRSVQGQSWPDWELLVVGQGDAAAEARLRAAVAKAAGDDARVAYVHLPERGAGRARNAGLRRAGGEIVAFIDDDCEADRDWLRTIVDAFAADPGLRLVGGASRPRSPGAARLLPHPDAVGGRLRRGGNPPPPTRRLGLDRRQRRPPGRRRPPCRSVGRAPGPGHGVRMRGGHRLQAAPQGSGPAHAHNASVPRPPLVRGPRWPRGAAQPAQLRLREWWSGGQANPVRRPARPALARPDTPAVPSPHGSCAGDRSGCSSTCATISGSSSATSAAGAGTGRRGRAAAAARRPRAGATQLPTRPGGHVCRRPVTVAGRRGGKACGTPWPSA